MDARSATTREWEAEQLYAACRSDDPTERSEAFSWLWTYLYRVTSYVLASHAGGDAMAQDAAQNAMIKIHARLDSCREPAAFIGWSRRIAGHAAIDLIRRDRRLQPLDPSEGGPVPRTAQVESPAAAVVAALDAESLRRLIKQAPLSNRSRRVVIGRYLDDVPDLVLAPEESRRAGKTVLPSHIQVTRSKNLSKLRAWPAIVTFAQSADGEQAGESSTSARSSSR